MAIKVNRFILCEDVRREANKKLIIIGMYEDDKIIINGKLPYHHPMLSLFVQCEGEFTEGEILYNIKDPANNIALQTEPIPFKSSGKKATLIANIAQFEFTDFGEYTATISFPGNQHVSVSFLVEEGKKIQGKDKN